MPFANFDSIKTEADVLRLFETEFPDALELMGKDLLLHNYFSNPTGALVTVKVACPRRRGVPRTNGAVLTVEAPGPVGIRLHRRHSAGRTTTRTASSSWATLPTPWCRSTARA